MDGSQTNWQGRTFVVRIDPSVIYPLHGGYATRVWVTGDYTLAKLFVGPVSARDPYIAAAMYQLTFNGGDKSVVVTVDDHGNFTPVVSDTFPIAIDGSRGLIVSGYVDPSGNGLMVTQSIQLGWSTRYTQGDHAGDVDKSTFDYVDTTDLYNSISVQMVEGNYTPPSASPTIL